MDNHEGDGGGGVFGAIITDMKQMTPILEEFLGKASKFYSAVRTSAATADSFLEAFQKLADATTSSKGSTKDLGVSFTKLVMRHKSIENKLKAFLGVFADSFIWPLQEKLEEYKKLTSQLEKDHSKDLKRVKTDTKKATSEVVKLKKKISKKGRQDHHDQYMQAVKTAEAHCTALEEQERHYLRRAMIEERTRMCHFFNCYRPVVEHEIALVSEIDNLQSILDETVKQCRNPTQLPLIADDVIRQYKAPERALLPKENQGSPPSTPLARDRAQTTSSMSSRASSTQSLSPTHSTCHSGTMTLNRSKAIQSASVYGTLRKNGPPPKPVDLPLPGSMSKAQLSPTDGGSRSLQYQGSSRTTSPNYPSPTDPMNPTGMEYNIHIATDNPDTADHSPTEQGVNGKIHNKASPGNKLSSRSSWSSTETSDSSGIGSHNSLTNPGRQNNTSDNNNGNSQQIVKDFLSGNTLEALETHLLGCEDIYSRMTYGAGTKPAVSPRNGHDQDYSNFTRNAFKSSSLRGPSGAMLNSRSILRSGSVQHDDDDHVQLAHEMKLNFQRGGRNATISGGRPSVGGRTSVFQVFGEQRSGAPLKSPGSGGSPVRWATKPPPPTRSVSYHGHRNDKRHDDISNLRKSSAPTDSREECFQESYEDANVPAGPNSFLAQIQERRHTIRRQSTVDNDNQVATLI